LITPAADAYHATAAVAMPTQPPRWTQPLLAFPCASSKLPITSKSSVASRVRKTRKTATLTCVDQSSMYVLKIANASRYHATAFGRFAPSSAPPKLFETTASTTKMPSDIQKPPYVANAVAPKTFRFRNSHMPASNCVSPP
jgi:hypothetical protein